MEFLIYLLRFYCFDFHIRYFRSLFRLATLLSHQFGIIPKLLSLFSPLFGIPGIGSRIQGVVLRLVAILFGIVFYFIFLAGGFAFYIML